MKTKSIFLVMLLAVSMLFVGCKKESKGLTRVTYYPVITLEGDIILGIVEGEFKPKALMGFMAAAITLLQDNYRDIMKIQWS